MLISRPLLPTSENLLPYLKRIDEARWYTNSGHLVREYEERMGSLFDCQVVATSSATSGMTAAWIAMELDDAIVMPSWTFIATANAVRAAGLDIEFTDVDEDVWTPGQTDIAVCPFGAPVNYENEILTDAAAAFDAYATGQSKVGAAPVVISTHATKCFSTGEGGLVLSRNKHFADRVREIINHGITLEREVPRVGINGKMSEYHAAVGLASLDTWPETKMKWFNTKQRYIEAFGNLAHTTPLSSLSWVGPTFAIRLPSIDHIEQTHGCSVQQAFFNRCILSRKIWGNGVHAYDAYKDCAKEGLPVTEKLARETVFLPFSLDTTDDELAQLVKYTSQIVNV